MAPHTRLLWCGALACAAAGALFALSFIATPVKFLAVDVSTAELLAVGRVTFRASLVAEIILLAILMTLAQGKLRYVLFGAAAILALQWLALMPLLDARTLAIMAGDTPPPSPSHLYWIAADVLRLGIYLLLATLSFKSALRASRRVVGFGGRYPYLSSMDGTDISQRPNFCQACTIRNRAICADLDNEEVTLLNRIGRKRHLQAGEQLLWEGEEAVLVANVLAGVLKLSTATAAGREQIVGLVYSSDFVGRPFAETTPYGAEALTDVEVCVFQRKDFDRFALEHPRLEHKLLERTLTELDRSRRWMLLLGKMNAQERVASFLIEMSQRLRASADGIDIFSGRSEFKLPLTRQQIADVLGLTIETVSRQFTQFKKDGVIEMPSSRTIIVPRHSVLAARAG